LQCLKSLLNESLNLDIKIDEDWFDPSASSAKLNCAHDSREYVLDVLIS
jgi:hypothetical protein